MRISVGCAVAALVINTWLVEGLVVPMSVASGSMAPAVRGPHRRWTCQSCAQPFWCNVESLPAPRRAAVCPNCRAPNDVAQGVDRPGDRVLVDRSAFLLRRPRRFELVVVRSPRDPRTLCVKRVVGLPGEQLHFADGDVWADGRIVRKTPDEEQAMAVAVHRAPLRERIAGADAVRARWIGPSSSWIVQNGAFVHAADSIPSQPTFARGALLAVGGHATFQRFAASPGLLREPLSPTRGEGEEQIDWLEYHHAPPSAGSAPSVAASISDESPYDQSESRVLHRVSDVMLRFQFIAARNAQLCVRAATAHDELCLLLDLETGRGTVSRDNRRVALFDARELEPGRAARLEWVLADQRLRVALDGRTRVAYEYRPGEGAAQGESGCLAIGARGAVQVRDLQVLRDVYYVAPSGDSSADRTLGADEYFLLGDNSVHSLDSRRWSPRGGVSAKLIVGKALLW